MYKQLKNERENIKSFFIKLNYERMLMEKKVEIGINLLNASVLSSREKKLGTLFS